MTIRGLLACTLLSLSAAAIAAAPSPPGVHVKNPWIRWLPANLPAAGYAEIVNDGDATARLVGASSPDYGSVMLHRSRLAQGDSTMEHVDHLDIPAHGSVTLSPGGYHLMLMHAKRPIKPGDSLKMTLDFAGGATLQVDFSVLPANASGPGAD
ncbi:MAG TPA: copper chaperone PCu(A)C [Rhodanobacteraceae bacterium]|jgi:copper(I)-binding protein|nr:copper chaperone PCu(A)C [Rhodanobacteraceae bacterium]